jgi:ATP-dependent DNA ligase
MIEFVWEGPHAELRSRFDWLRDPDPAEVATPPLLMVFDLLYRAGRDQTKRPLRERRARFEEIVAGAERIFPVRRLTSDGLVAWDEVLRAGFEDYVAKEEAAPTRAGRHDGG